VGCTIKGIPVPTGVPAQEPVLQYQFANVPSVPPLIFKETEEPGHIPPAGDAVAVVAEIELTYSETVTLTQVVVLHELIALTQNIVVDTGATDNVDDVPDESTVPVHEPVDHFQTAPVPSNPPLIVIVEEEPGHIDVGEADNEEGRVEGLLTVMFTVTHAVVLQNPTAFT
jgi:hypothetical protein